MKKTRLQKQRGLFSDPFHGKIVKVQKRVAAEFWKEVDLLKSSEQFKEKSHKYMVAYVKYSKKWCKKRGETYLGQKNQEARGILADKYKWKEAEKKMTGYEFHDYVKVHLLKKEAKKDFLIGVLEDQDVEDFSPGY